MRWLLLALAAASLGGCAGGGAGSTDPSPATLPGAPVPAVSADGLTPAQQAEIDAVVAAYRSANLDSAAPPAAGPAANARPIDAASNQGVPPAATTQPVAPDKLVSWLDPGGTGAGTAAPVVAVVAPAVPVVVAPEPPPPVVVSTAAPAPFPTGPPGLGGAGLAAPAGMVEIADLRLCRSVSGFGVFEPFEDHTFTAGAAVRMVLYVEIDGFATDVTPVPAAAGGEGDAELHRVRLEQEVLLFRDADGLLVWSREPQKIQDESRRKRRDFWSVQLLELPANLGVGRYRLKVTLRDEVSNTVDERSVPLRLVAEAP